MTLTLENVDFTNAKHEKDMIFLLDHYAKDPMGGGKVLTKDVKANLAPSLAKLPHAFALLAYVNEEPAITNLVKKFIEWNEEKNYVNGWRIQIINTDDRRKMERAMKQKY